MEKKRVLVVDDEPDFVSILKIRLEAEGYEVLSAGNGKDALANIEKGGIDVVLLDVMMPGMDGLEVLKKIRKNNKNLPVYIITAFSNKERFELAKNLDASGFIVKTDDLKKEVDNITAALGIAKDYRKV